ncbi:MAG: PKD domain-containing protein [Bacteroidetes bacterium]|nr:MAG: PKD domain-containing protein [Bacteroidota bacterium]
MPEKMRPGNYCLSNLSFMTFLKRKELCTLKVRTIIFGFLFSLFQLNSFHVLAQQDIQLLNADSINQLKIDGKLTGKEFFSNSRARISQSPNVVPNPSSLPPLTCDCWITRDASWQVGAFDGSGASGGPGLPPDYRNDDWSTLPIALPFNFCFYGANVNSLFLNNNGNVSIGAAEPTFTASPFPNNQFVMIAPFWGDVDTRGPLSGLVYYRITPTHMVIQWENVGYFSQQDDKLNTFQLILTDGNDPIIPAGQNTSFCYKDMQWTTGSASGGVNGFGGTAATVGVNRGNGTDYIQVGLFDTAGAAYDGPFNNNDGIDALDYQSFYFNSCVSSSNVAPLVTAIQVCDTIKVCINDSAMIHAEFLSPEQGQITTAGVNPNGMTGVSILNSTSGNTASIDVQISGISSNVGYHTIFITGTDDGTPPLTNSTPVIVQIMPAPTTNFSYLPASPVSPGTMIQFTSSSVGAFGFVWNFGDGSPTSNLMNPTHSYSSPGTYDVSLTTTGPNGCSSTKVEEIIVAACASASFTVVDTICQGSSTLVTFTGIASAGATFTWNFGNATVLSGSGRGPYSIVWNSPGNETVSLSVTDNPCATISTSLSVNVIPIPVASITTNATVCAGDQTSVIFNGTAQANASYTWNVGSATIVAGNGTTTNPYTLLWNTVGPTNLSLIVNQNGCRDTAQANVQVYAIPTSAFTAPASVCANSSIVVAYTGNATAGASYTWDFDGGSILSGSGQGPYSLSWNTDGNKNITLSVNENGCSSTPTIIPVRIDAIPVASFTADPSSCPGVQNTVNFTGSPSGGANYIWDFGTATVISGSGSGPYVLSWSSPGQMNINLIVENNGCNDTTMLAVTVFPTPTSTFSYPASICPGDTAQIIYTGSAGPGSTYTWDFAGGTVISGTDEGPYLVSWPGGGTPALSLIVNENGCPSILTQNNISIAPLPIVSAGSDVTICSGTSTLIGSNPSAGTTYLWYPSTGLIDPNASSTTVQGTTSGVFAELRNYILRATSSLGCTNSDSIKVTINPVPTSVFTSPLPQCLDNNSFKFYLSGTVIPGAQYIWDFGPLANPQQSNLAAPPPVSYPQIGTYAVTVQASYGPCIAPPFTDSVRIIPNPVANFSALIVEGCVPLTVPFVNQSSGLWNNYVWTFSDQSTDTSAQALHVFTSPGTYTVELLAQTTNGCTDKITYNDLIRVNPKPVPAFFPSPQTTSIFEPMIQFINSTTGINSYTWEFGDGDSSYAVNPDHLYREIGEYTVSLYVTNIYGCKDTITALVRIEDDFTFYIPNTFSPNGDGKNDFFGGFGTRLKSYQMDIFDRWGLLVYSTDDILKPWDGKNNNNVQADVYIYKIRVTDNKNQGHEYTGHVNIVR